MAVRYKNFIIRSIKAGDLIGKGSLYDTLERLSPSPKVNQSQIIKKFGASSKTSRCFVAVSDKEVIGTVTLWIISRIPRGHQKLALIEDVVVKKKYEGQGIGQALINEALKLARERNCQRARLMCKPELEKFYRKSSFNKDGISMRLELDKRRIK